MFKSSPNDALAELDETKLWSDFALYCGRISDDAHGELAAGYHQIGAMLWTLMNKWRRLE